MSGADLQLFIAGIFFGTQIATLREPVLAKLFDGCSRMDAMQLAIAATNRQVLIGKQKLNATLHARKKNPDEAGHMGSIAEMMIDTPQGLMKATAVATAAIDALPHWFAQAADLPKPSQGTRTTQRSTTAISTCARLWRFQPNGL
ncbi:MAG: hypothetical protein QM759_04960 [Terricaulis sp.]